MASTPPEDERVDCSASATARAPPARGAPNLSPGRAARTATYSFCRRRPRAERRGFGCRGRLIAGRGACAIRFDRTCWSRDLRARAIFRRCTVAGSGQAGRGSARRSCGVEAPARKPRSIAPSNRSDSGDASAIDFRTALRTSKASAPSGADVLAHRRDLLLEVAPPEPRCRHASCVEGLGPSGGVIHRRVPDHGEVRRGGGGAWSCVHRERIASRSR